MLARMAAGSARRRLARAGGLTGAVGEQALPAASGAPPGAHLTRAGAARAAAPQVPGRRTLDEP